MHTLRLGSTKDGCLEYGMLAELYHSSAFEKKSWRLQTLARRGALELRQLHLRHCIPPALFTITRTIFLPIQHLRRTEPIISQGTADLTH